MTERIPARGLLAALCALALILDFLAALFALALGRWVYLISLIIVGALTWAALRVLRSAE